MATRIVMPQLGESVTEGTVTRWLKREGEWVERDEPLAEVMTDKVNAEIPSPASGVLVKLSVPEGTKLTVGEEMAVLEEVGAERAIGGEFAVGQAEAVSHNSATGNDRPARSLQTEEAAGGRYSPLVRRLAREHGVDLAEVQGTGIGGRVTKEDVLRYVAERQSTPQPEQPTIEAPLVRGRIEESPQSTAALQMPKEQVTPAGQDIETIVPSPMRLAIAERMQHSKQTAPHAWTMIEVDMTGLVRWRDVVRLEFEQREGFALTYLPFVVKAAVSALKEQPMLNASWIDNKIVVKKSINIGIAVALEEGLIVPVLHHADQMSIAGLAKAINDLAGRARGGRLTPNDVQGGTFTVNNPGAFGSVISMPIINQGQAGILAMESIVKRPVVRDDAIAIRSMMNLALSFDHRVVDGLTVGRFLQDVKRRLEAYGPSTSLY